MVTDLFSYRPPKYPETPGYKNETTSKIAARRIEPHVSRLADEVLSMLKAEPRTAWEIEQASEMRAATITARIRELVLKGMVEDSGDRRPTYSGRPAIVWRAK